MKQLSSFPVSTISLNIWLHNSISCHVTLDITGTFTTSDVSLPGSTHIRQLLKFSTEKNVKFWLLRSIPIASTTFFPNWWLYNSVFITSHKYAKASTAS
jgi:hypothetical protein